MTDNTSLHKQGTTQHSNKDAALALVLLFLLIAIFSGSSKPLIAALIVLIGAMTLPDMFEPFAIVWFGLSHVLGNISSRLVLTLLFIFIVIPIGISRRVLGSDPLNLRGWRSRSESAFNKALHTYSASDLTSPY